MCGSSCVCPTHPAACVCVCVMWGLVHTVFALTCCVVTLDAFSMTLSEFLIKSCTHTAAEASTVLPVNCQMRANRL